MLASRPAEYKGLGVGGRGDQRLWGGKGTLGSATGATREPNLERLDVVQHFPRVSRDLHATPLARKLARAVDHKSAALDPAHFLTVHVLHLDDGKLRAKLFVRVGYQFERKFHFRLEVFVRLQAVAGDTDNDRARLDELAMQVAKLHAFGRAARRVVPRIEINDDRIALVRGQLELTAGRGG